MVRIDQWLDFLWDQSLAQHSTLRIRGKRLCWHCLSWHLPPAMELGCFAELEKKTARNHREIYKKPSETVFPRA